MIHSRMKNFIIILLFFISNFSYSQKEGNMWYFGQNAALDFNSGVPVSLNNSAMNQWEGCASIANSNGVLLFYTDGMSVWNASHSIMPNGTGLLGGNSSTQSSVIVKQPGSNTLYYVFTTDYYSFQGCNYSIVDMSLNSGLGDVTVKNVNLFMNATEKLTAVAHSNGVDFWIITHQVGNNSINAYLLTAAGFNSTPVVSSVGPAINTAYDATGYLKVSPDATRMAMAIQDANEFWLFDFNSTTGIVTNPIMLTTPATWVYGVEFSPNSQVLYGTTINPVDYISQWDITLGSAAAINASRYDIVTINGWGLNLGPDNKLYIARHLHSYLSAINNPNVLGAGCNYVDTAVLLGVNKSTLGLPNFHASIFNTGFTFTQLCLGDSTYFTLSDTAGLQSVSWNFGDASAGINNISSLFAPAHLYSVAGTFHVRLIRNYTNYTDTVLSDLTISQRPSVNLGSDTTFCIGNSYTIVPGSGYSNYIWQNGSTDSVFTTTSGGNFWVTVSNGTCSNTDSITLNSIPCNLPTTDFTVSDFDFCPNTCIDFTDLSASSPTSWTWSFPGGLPSTSTLQNPSDICYSTPGNYNVSLIACNNSGCDTLNMTNLITVFPPVNFAPIVQIGDTLFSVPGFSVYQWYDSSSAIPGADLYYYIPLHNGTYSVQVTDNNGCNALATMFGVTVSDGEEIERDIFVNGFYHDGLVSLTLNGISTSPAQVQIFDVTGKLIISDILSIERSAGSATIDTGILTSGLYIIRIEYGSKSLKKILVVNSAE